MKRIVIRDCAWSKSSAIKKRIDGFICYQIQSLVALINPEIADVVMFRTLSEQFEEREVVK